jgi:hypothetical protein
MENSARDTGVGEQVANGEITAAHYTVRLNVSTEILDVRET